LAQLPVLTLQTGQSSRFALRRIGGKFCAKPVMGMATLSTGPRQVWTEVAFFERDLTVGIGVLFKSLK
jgi:hypothetical protein